MTIAPGSHGCHPARAPWLGLAEPSGLGGVADLRPLSDGLYRWVARNRYCWFGRSQHRIVPNPPVVARFLD